MSLVSHSVYTVGAGHSWVAAKDGCHAKAASTRQPTA